MNAASQSEPSSSADHPAREQATGPPSPANWRESLLDLISSRLALIELEAKELAKAAIRRASALALVACCLLFMWALVLAGGITILAQATGWSWPWLALAVAALHLLAAWILIRGFTRSAATPAFPVTRAEFQKDRQWINNFQTTRKSND